MIIMNKRSCDILQNLINKERPPFIKEFSRYFNVTERTIRSDINDINTLFSQMNIPPIKTVRDGLILLDPDVDYSPVRKKIKKMGYYYYRMSPRERQSIIILILINRDSYITMSELSETLFVSRQTIMSDISEIEGRLHPYDISINCQAKKGVRIEFTETSIRSLIISILGENFTNVRNQSVFGNMIFSEISTTYFINDISKWLQKYENQAKLNLSDEGFQNLLLYSFVAANRISMGNTIENEEVRINKFEYRLAQGIIKNLASEFDLTFTSKEVDSLAAYIREKRIYPLSKNINMYPEINVIIANFLFSVFRTLKMNLSERDHYKLFKFLIFHIKAMAERVHCKDTLNNPFREQIKSEYKDVYTAVKENIYLLEDYLNTNVQEDEIAFIAMHIRAAIERQDVVKPKLSIVVACPGSMATGQLLAAQIRKYFDIEIQDIIAKDRMVENLHLDEREIDFVVSSVALPECNLPTVVVNPILREEDFYSIHALAFSVYESHKESMKDPNPLSLYQDITGGDFSTINEKILLPEADWKEFNQVVKRDEKEENQSPFLYEILQPNLIEIGASASNWRIAIRKAGSILVDNRFTSPEYINLMIANVEDYGPYCVISKGLALAHAESKGTVYCSGMSLLVLEDGVQFEHEENDPVHLLFCFCVNDNRNYLQSLTNLIAMSKQERFFDDIFSAQSVKEVYQLIKKREIVLNGLQKEIN